jgi:hypothetical protein
MARLLVTSATWEGPRLGTVRLALHGLPERTVPRDELVRLLADGHGVIPALNGRLGPALGIVEVHGASWVRADGCPEPADTLGG